MLQTPIMTDTKHFDVEFLYKKMDEKDIVCFEGLITKRVKVNTWMISI